MRRVGWMRRKVDEVVRFPHSTMNVGAFLRFFDVGASEGRWCGWRAKELGEGHCWRHNDLKLQEVKMVI